MQTNLSTETISKLQTEETKTFSEDNADSRNLPQPISRNADSTPSLQTMPLKSTESLSSDLKELLKQPRIIGRVPKPGFAFNPLRTLNRNMPCPCLSGKKFKKCHLNLLPEVIPEKDASVYREVIRKTGTFFFTTQKADETKRTTLAEKMEKFETVELGHCLKCKNRWWFDRKTDHECTTCGHVETEWQ